MKPLQILMPMGGLGSRFAQEGYTIPKPLIEVDGKPMFMRALDSFSTINETEYIFVIRKEHDEAYDLANKIRQQLPNAKIAVLNHDTGGAVETCLIAEGYITDAPIIIADCDIYFESREYFEKLSKSRLAGKPDGMLLTFQSDNPRYSYVEIDEKGKAVRTAEKVVISNHAILGGYFFNSGTLFKDLANEFVANGLPQGLKEYFMSHLFNILLDRKLTIEIADVDIMHIFGTPEELNQYLAREVK
jgi:dTDP-glucose pyrophosphorylase